MLGTQADEALDAASESPSGASTPEELDRFTEAALSELASAPGVAPFVAARIGLEHQNEADLAYTGRALRLGFRHAFESGEYALSLGLGGTGVLTRAGDVPEPRPDDALRNLRAFERSSSTGYGLDVPILAGYRSTAEVVQLWAGLRAGFERSRHHLTLVTAPDRPMRAEAEADRYWGGGLLGFAIGLNPIQVAVELQAAYEHVSGELLSDDGRRSGELGGVSLMPAAAISGKF